MSKTFGPILWQNVAEGMSVDDVTTVCPSVSSINCGDKYNDGSQELLQIKPYNVIGRKFLVKFIFLDNELIEVRLTYDNKTRVGEFISICQELLKALTAKYGEPKKNLIKDNGDSGFKICFVWETSGIVVDLGYVYMKNIDYSIFGLRYESQERVARRNAINEESERRKKEDEIKAIAHNADLL